MKNKKIFGMVFITILIISVSIGMNKISLDSDRKISSKDIDASKSNFNAVSVSGISITISPTEAYEGDLITVIIKNSEGEEITNDIEICKNGEEPCKKYYNFVSGNTFPAPYLDESETRVDFSVCTALCGYSDCDFLIVNKKEFSMNYPSEINEGKPFTVTVTYRYEGENKPASGLTVVLKAENDISSITGTDGTASITAPAVDLDVNYQLIALDTNNLQRCSGDIKIKHTFLVVENVPDSIDEHETFEVTVTDQDGNKQNDAFLYFSGALIPIPKRGPTASFTAKEVSEDTGGFRFSATLINNEFMDDYLKSDITIKNADPIFYLQICCVDEVDEGENLLVTIIDPVSGNGIEGVNVLFCLQSRQTGQDGVITSVFKAPLVKEACSKTISASKSDYTVNSKSIKINNIEQEPGDLKISVDERIIEGESFTVNLVDANSGESVKGRVHFNGYSNIISSSTITIPKQKVPLVTEDTEYPIKADADNYNHASDTITVHDIGLEVGYISGYVYDALSDGGMPIKGATVSSNTGQSDNTDDSGYYELQAEAPKLIILTASHSGYSSKSQIVNVNIHEDYSIDFKLYPKSNDVTITGTVKNSETKAPIKGATVSTAGISDLTNTLGKYSFQVSPYIPKEGDKQNYIIYSVKVYYNDWQTDGPKNVYVYENTRELNLDFLVTDNNANKKPDSRISTDIKINDNIVVNTNTNGKSSDLLPQNTITNTILQPTQSNSVSGNTQTTGIAIPLSVSITKITTGALQVNSPVKFSASVNGGSGSRSYEWVFEDDSKTYASSSVSHSWSSSGYKTITLKATDSTGTDSDSMRIYISLSQPTSSQTNSAASSSASTSTVSSSQSNLN